MSSAFPARLFRLREHLAAFVTDEPGALVFANETGMPLRRSNFKQDVQLATRGRIDRAAGLHVHDLRHTGNQFAAKAARLFAT